MIIWYDKLYLDEFVSRKKENIIERIESNKLNFEIYCISLATNENNLFDIINVNELLFKHYRRNKIQIIGIASSKASAFELAAEIIQEMYENTNSFDVREYFKFV